jgi:hypothetical protein
VASEVAKVRGELAAYREFASLAERIVEVSEAICEARPAGGTGSLSSAEGEKRGSATRSPGRRRLR